MRFIAIGLAAAFFAAALSPVAAYAADKPAKPGADITADPKKHQQGMADVPALIQQTGIDCTPTDAFMLGQNKGKDAATGKDVNNKYYEVACQQGLGYMIVAPDSGAAAAYDCLGMSINKPKPGEGEKGQVYCRLAPNADPMKGLGPIVAKAGVPNCEVSDAKYVGSSTTDKVDEYEVACSNGQAYVLQSPRTNSDKKLVLASCLTMDPGKCALFPKEKYVATLTAMIAPSGRQCQVSDGRYIGTSASNKNSFYEVGCSNQPVGFVVQVDADNKYVAAIDCARATTIGNGCTLTSAAAAQTEANDTYAKLAKSIGYPCDVKSYHSFGQDTATKREVVELSCGDHPDGAIALLPIDAGQKGEYFNCVRAELRGLKCALTPPEATYARITSQISAAGKTCQVSNARAVGKTSDGAEFVETTCTGGPGVMVEYLPNSEKVKSVTACAQATGIGGGCKLSK